MTNISQEQTLPEPPRTRQEVVRASFLQPPEVGRLVHIVAALFTQLAVRLCADRQPAPAHCGPDPTRLPRPAQTLAPDLGSHEHLFEFVVAGLAPPRSRMLNRSCAI